MENIINERYLIKNLIGSGGMADVYLATDTILDRNIALKIIRIDLAQDPISLLRFQREAKAISKMDHQNIVQVYDVGEYNHRPYIVMEYVHGKTLKQLLQKRIALPIDEALDIMKQLTSALVHAHQNSIIHRDIKPHNVLIKDDGTAKITDFGIALSHDSMQITANDMVLGSAHYLAPELTSGEEATHASDIYALGIVFYELLTGFVPFNAGTPVQVAMAHINETMPSLTKINKDIPPQIEQIVFKACAKNKAERYQSAEEMLFDLENYLNVKVNKKTNLIGKKSMPLKQFTLMCVGVASAVVIGFTGIMALMQNRAQPIDKLIVPDVLGKTKEEAETLLKNQGFVVEINPELIPSQHYIGGSVAEIKPAVNTMLSNDKKVVLSISKAKLYEMPNFVGLNISRAYDKFVNDNILITIKEKIVPSQSTNGTILKQSVEANKSIELNSNTVIEFEIAGAPHAILIPKVEGLTIENANKILSEKGIKVNQVGKGKVVSQSIEAFTVVEYIDSIEITIKGDS